MSMSDPVGDMLTRIRNAQRARHSMCLAPASKLRDNVLGVLKREGFIRAMRLRSFGRHRAVAHRAEVQRGRTGHQGDQPCLQAGRRVYAKIKELPRVYAGLGISILSTPQGVMSDAEARAANVGGEVLCRVF